LRAQIEILAALQIIDREIREHAAVKQGLLSELQEKQRLVQERKHEIEALTAACAAKEKLRLEKDKLLHEESQKATDKRMRMNRIKNVKELQALQREIDQIRQTNGEAEEEFWYGTGLSECLRSYPNECLWLLARNWDLSLWSRR